MADTADRSSPTEMSPDDAQPQAAVRWLAAASAWLSGFALAALVVSIAAFIIDANRPQEPTTTITLNGRAVSGEDAKDMLLDVGSRLFQTVTGREEGAPDEADPAAAPTVKPIGSGGLEVEVRSNESAAERAYKHAFWMFVGLGLTGSATGGIARWCGVRGGAVAFATWPVWFLGILAMAVPSCAG